MRYFKRFASLLLLLALIVTCLVFPVSATEADAGSASTYSLSEPGGDDGFVNFHYGDTVYEIDVSNCTNWSEVISNNSQTVGTISITSGGVVCFTPKNSDTTYLVLDYKNVNEVGSKSISWEDYYLSTVIEFTITELDPFTGSFGIKYSFSETVTGGFTLGQLVSNKFVFYNADLGICQFFYEADDLIVFGVGKKVDDTFTNRYVLMKPYNNDKDAIVFASPSNTLVSGDYYAIDACKLDFHLYGSFIKVSDPTCTEDGKSVGVCKYCEKEKVVFSAALKHNPDIWGTCRTCGTNVAVDFITGGVGNLWNDLTGGGADEGGGGSGNDDGGAGGGDGNESGTDSDGGFFAGIGKLFKKAGDAIANWLGLDKVSDTVSSLIKTVVIVTFCCVLIGLIPVLTPFFKWVWNGVVFTWNSLKDLFKSIGNSVSKSSRSRKGKNKKRTKK